MSSAALCAALILWTPYLSFAASSGFCNAPPSIPRTTASIPDEGEYEVGTKVTYSCDFGYLAEGSKLVSECKDGNRGDAPFWTTIDISCNPRSCGDPGFVDHARREGSQFTFASSVIYNCDLGYKISGYATRYCQTNGDWSGKLPSCKRVSCKAPVNPPNARVLYTSLEYGSSLRYECEKGYRLEMKTERLCSSDGQWSGEDPSCVESFCEDPVAPEHGKISIVGGTSKVGSIAVFSCEGDRKIVGSKTAKCLETGDWTFPVPKCVEPCTIPVIQNGKIGVYEKRWRDTVFKPINVAERIQEGQQLSLKCDRNYKAAGESSRETNIICINGRWNIEPQCSADACRSDPPPVDNAHSITPERTHGTSITYSCNDGFEKSAYGNVVCNFGSWQGKTPICKGKPCFIPFVQNGQMGLNEDVRNGEQFKAKNVNAKVESTQWVYLKCKEGYEPSSEQESMSETNQMRITCTNERWDVAPLCIPARCKRQQLASFPGLVLDGKLHYINGDVVIPKCSGNFELSKKENNELTCMNGQWLGHLPPCKAERCQGRPPEPENGRVVSYSEQHGTDVKYACNTWYYLEYSQVQCQYGEWTGKLPSCKDNRCYLKDLYVTDGVDLTHGSMTYSGQQANIQCIEGYTPTYTKPKCSNGIWETQRDFSWCQPSRCQVREIPDGEIKYSEWTETGFFRKVKKQEFKKATIGSYYDHEQILYVTCESPYLFHGKDAAENVKIQCQYGKWSPVPACMKKGNTLEVQTTGSSIESRSHETRTTTNLPGVSSELVPTNISPNYESEASVTEQVAQPNLGVSAGEIFLEDQNDTSVSIGNSTENDTEKPNLGINNSTDTCFCIYNLQDDDVLAVAENKFLAYGAQVKKGCSVEFLCKKIGHQRLRGKQKLQCLNCNWHSSEFPSCVNPSSGHPYIEFKSEPKYSIYILPSGKLSIVPGVRVILYCTIKNTQGYPEWEEPKRRDIIVDYDYDRVHMQYTNTYLVIESMQSKYNGKYKCRSPAHHYSEVEIQVEEWYCPLIDENDSLIVTYSENGTYSSTASFSCLDKDMLMTVPAKVTCLSTREWSGNPPKCDYIKCPTLSVSNYLAISYEQDRKVNSRAIFHCSPPSVRHGDPYVECLQNGRWSGPVSSCLLVTCSIESLFEVVPQGVVPIMTNVNSDTLPYGGILNLECNNKNLLIMGNSTAKCDHTGKWKIDNVQCVTGCAPLNIPEKSDVIISPRKMFYRFGEFATFSCPPNRTLTEDVERVMCLENGWSPKVFPDCYYKKV